MEKFFKGYGRIREINLKNGFGFVVSDSLFSAPGSLVPILRVLFKYKLFFCWQEFDDHRDADDAVYELNGKELCSER